MSAPLSARRKGGEGEAIVVCIRLRPFNSREVKMGAKKCVEIAHEEEQVILRNPDPETRHVRGGVGVGESLCNLC
jgi:hypothetical protein